ncbi:hypothetical protein IAG44_16285 [Streptomyces roseirectus]|uniref:Uncharacterized protein n=1 Tax=Streptomyces roseirectus TaxID=2768066 RepID=A0A7H0IDH3_9ACTN|nr:hypothetical protein [Streptomyces roseirectus]QNP70839.1 hypothetical protein IAG44_16285 [Streptomyces roseirectus]
MIRLRIRIVGGPRRALALTDTPRRDCPDCHGTGSIEDAFVDEFGEYAGSNWWFCDCQSDWTLPLLPLPRWPRRRPRGGYSDEPPF